MLPSTSKQPGGPLHRLLVPADRGELGGLSEGEAIVLNLPDDVVETVESEGGATSMVEACRGGPG